jgi:SAM-dependent methyltransferase
MIDNYKSLCVLYYDVDKPTPPKEEYLFYRFFLEKYQDNILEPMCGSGRFLVPFLKEGFNIDGFDASYPMVQALQNRLSKELLEKNIPISLFQNYIFNKKYNLIYIPSGSLSLLYNIVDFEKAILTIYNNLNFGGSFVFEVETPEILEKDSLDFKLIANHLISIDKNNKILGSFINHTYYDQVLTISCRYDLIKDDYIIKTEFEDIIIRLFSYAQIVSILQKVGFTVFCYKNFKKELFDHDLSISKLLILECVKNR